MSKPFLTIQDQLALTEPFKRLQSVRLYRNFIQQPGAVVEEPLQDFSPWSGHSLCAIHQSVENGYIVTRSVRLKLVGTAIKESSINRRTSIWQSSNRIYLK